jgi:hypothetical protein
VTPAAFACIVAEYVSRRIRVLLTMAYTAKQMEHVDAERGNGADWAPQQDR